MWNWQIFFFKFLAFYLIHSSQADPAVLVRPHPRFSRGLGTTLPAQPQARGLREPALQLYTLFRYVTNFELQYETEGFCQILIFF